MESNNGGLSLLSLLSSIKLWHFDLHIKTMQMSFSKSHLNMLKELLMCNFQHATILERNLGAAFSKMLTYTLHFLSCSWMPFQYYLCIKIMLAFKNEFRRVPASDFGNSLRAICTRFLFFCCFFLFFKEIWDDINKHRKRNRTFSNWF